MDDKPCVEPGDGCRSPTSTSTGHNSADADIGGGGHMLHSPPGSGTVGTRSISGGDRNDALMQMPSEVILRSSSVYAVPGVVHVGHALGFKI